MSAELVPVEVGVVRPFPSTSVVGALAEYRKLCDQVLEDADWQVIGRGKDAQKFLKRRGWRKLALGFGVSTELLTEKVERDEGGAVVWAEFRARAVAANGRSAEGVGYADRKERRFGKDHDIIATASTRAINRALADLFGLGAVSAEEVDAEGLGAGPLAGSPGEPAAGSSRRPTGPVASGGPAPSDWRQAFAEAVHNLPGDFPAGMTPEHLATAIIECATGRRGDTHALADEDRDAVLEVFRQVRDAKRVLHTDGSLSDLF